MGGSHHILRLVSFITGEILLIGLVGLLYRYGRLLVVYSKGKPGQSYLVCFFGVQPGHLGKSK